MSRDDTIVVLSDLHANARALRRAIAIARAGRVDRWIVLGDLLTYGVDITETLELVDELVRVDGATVILGNHDQLYVDLAAGDRAYYASLPEWIRESADLTLAGFDAASFARRYAWRDELVVGDILFAHASPFGARDWRYIASDDDRAAAAAKLRERGHRVGVFGHVHRFRRLHGDATTVVTAGSLGQPRDNADPRSSFLRVTGAQVEHVPVDYDVAAHVAGLRAAALSEPTKLKLCSFF
jgi:predicted phosphodiesterase